MDINEFVVYAAYFLSLAACLGVVHISFSISRLWQTIAEMNKLAVRQNDLAMKHMRSTGFIRTDCQET